MLITFERLLLKIAEWSFNDWLSSDEFPHLLQFWPILKRFDLFYPSHRYESTIFPTVSIR
jgi:hypothetical protein